MGYILPVTNYQYIQYAERDTDTDYDPFHIGKINRIRKENPVQREKEQEQGEVAARMQKAAQEFSLPRADRIYKRKVHPIVVSKTFAELTGKGKHYSETI